MVIFYLMGRLNATLLQLALEIALYVLKKAECYRGNSIFPPALYPPGLLRLISLVSQWRGAEKK